MEGWKRSIRFNETELPLGIDFSPIPYMQSVYYPVSGILGELGIMSIGVGYTVPFQTFALKYLMQKNYHQVNALRLNELYFAQFIYKPYYGYGKDKNLKRSTSVFTNYTTARLSEFSFMYCRL